MIEKYAFVNLPKLKYLSLSNNPYLIHVGGKSFGHTIPGIQVLKLSNNAIDLLPGKGFDWLVFFLVNDWLALTEQRHHLRRIEAQKGVSRKRLSVLHDPHERSPI